MVGAMIHDDEMVQVWEVWRQEGEPISALQMSVQSGGREIVERLVPEWRELCFRAHSHLAFLRPEIVLAFLDAHAPKDRVVVLTARRGGRLVALLPLLDRSIGVGSLRVRWLRAASKAQFQRYDAVYADEDPDVIAEAFMSMLSRHFPDHMLHAEMAAEDGVLSRLQALAAARGQLTRNYEAGASPYIAVPPPHSLMEDVISAQGKRVRRFLRSGLRRVRKRGSLRFVSVTDAAEGKSRAEWLEIFCDLEHKGWKGDGSTSINSSVELKQFYEAIANADGLRSSFRCFALMVNDEMFAADIGFFIGDTYFSGKIAINEDYRDCSPGHLLHLYLLMECSRMGIKELNLGGKAESYKLFWTDTTHPFSTIVVFPQGLKGRALNVLIFKAVIPARDYLISKPKARQVRRALRRLPGLG